jgi:hypothetical protein
MAQRGEGQQAVSAFTALRNLSGIVARCSYPNRDPCMPLFFKNAGCGQLPVEFDAITP